MVYRTKSVLETEDAGYQFAAGLHAGDVVALTGGLGAGKTAFVRGIARRLCPEAEVSSPTFTIAHEYEGEIPVFHFDMYRISSFDDLYNIAFFDYLDRGGVSVIEWSENIEDALPEGTIRVDITVDGDGRRITVGERQ
mgnify:CR=1 FL=1